MTRKDDYVEIAGAINDTLKEIEAGTSPIETSTKTEGIGWLVENLEGRLIEDNPSFSRSKFRTACFIGTRWERDSLIEKILKQVI